MNYKAKKYIVTVIFCFISYILSVDTATADQGKVIVQIESYLNSIKSISANFKQIGPEADSIRSGELYISKPGKFKWDYIAPKRITIIGSNGQVAFYDHEMEELSQISHDDAISELLTKNQISITKSMNILSLIEGKEYIELIVSKKNQNIKELEVYPYFIMKFKQRPKLTLDSFYLVNDEHSITEIMLSNIVFNQKIDDNIFSFKNPKFFELNRD